MSDIEITLKEIGSDFSVFTIGGGVCLEIKDHHGNKTLNTLSLETTELLVLALKKAKKQACKNKKEKQ